MHALTGRTPLGCNGWLNPLRYTDAAPLGLWIS